MQQPLLFRLDRLSILSFMWAVTALIHPWPFYRRIVSGQEGVLSILLALAAVAVILRPKSVYLFLFMLAVSILHAIDGMPFLQNHIMFEAALQLFILGCIVSIIAPEAFRNRLKDQLTSTEFRNKLFDSFAPVARISIVILYFFAVFHKLNSGFFDITISQSIHLLKDIKQHIQFLPLTDTIKYVSVWGTVITETAIAVLLCFRSTRLHGIFLAMIFHIFISFNPMHRGFTSFSGMLYTLFFFFTPKELPAALSEITTNIWCKLTSPKTITIKLIVIALLAIISVLGYLIYNWNTLYGKTGLYYSVYSLIIVWWLFLFMSLLFATRYYKMTPEAHAFRLPFKLHILFPALLVLNGMLPYLGLKTNTSFNMFTNLRTEGGYTNHLFIPASLQVFDFQKDLVQIKSTNLEELKTYAGPSKKMMVYFEFSRTIANTTQDAYIEYIHNGLPQRLEIKNGKIQATESIKKYPDTLYKLMWFKQVYASMHSLDIDH
ncbi:HTTM domain-containing protein [Pontibacter vulgaris]|uniref:HTTM domain-containing protein n=1 Tax=Pontibacter vulgaris TaxID=2905679 RepID=UPI001FA7044F|nr:HTTM domain-containing protein [Pontibacter vulgaris]